MKYLKHIVCTFFLVFTITFSWAQATDSIQAIEPIQSIDPIFIADPAFSYNSVHYRGSAVINIDNQTQNCQFTLVSVIDSFLYIQLSFMGIEAGRALITPDQILMINKLQKNYYEGDYSILQHILDLEVDFYALQAIFNSFPLEIPDGIELSYQGELMADGYTFFNRLILESVDYELKLQLDVKKVTFNEVPKVSATVPKNYSEIKFWEED
ncbi:MAG: DUF4292 domain-containing protein [Bacteroidetes bacterium]|nr:DUF4292 domain-containing protein [Bacteroidota bacterium]MCL2303100.1 DUF4292 domain-containing protein [Lentimicrobiaceae bacterium]